MAEATAEGAANPAGEQISKRDAEIDEKRRMMKGMVRSTMPMAPPKLKSHMFHSPFVRLSIG